MSIGTNTLGQARQQPKPRKLLYGEPRLEAFTHIAEGIANSAGSPTAETSKPSAELAHLASLPCRERATVSLSRRHGGQVPLRPRFTSRPRSICEQAGVEKNNLN